MTFKTLYNWIKLFAAIAGLVISLIVIFNWFSKEKAETLSVPPINILNKIENNNPPVINLSDTIGKKAIPFVPPIITSTSSQQNIRRSNERKNSKPFINSELRIKKKNIYGEGNGAVYFYCYCTDKEWEINIVGKISGETNYEILPIYDDTIPPYPKSKKVLYHTFPAYQKYVVHLRSNGIEEENSLPLTLIEGECIPFIIPNCPKLTTGELFRKVTKGMK